jgi:hypothetical protein
VVSKLVSARYVPLDSYLIIQEEVANRLGGFPKEAQRSLLLKSRFKSTNICRFRPTDLTFEHWWSLFEYFLEGASERKKLFVGGQRSGFYILQSADILSWQEDDKNTQGVNSKLP